MTKALSTTLGKAAALKALAERREFNKTRVRVDDSTLWAGSPMHFDCLTCGGEIVVPEDYNTRPMLCRECYAMKELSWLLE